MLALPSRKSSKVREITTADGPLEKAGTAQAVTVVLEDEIDLSRGDVLVHPDHRPTLARTFDAHLIWMGEAPLLPGKRYEFKIGSRYVKGLVDSIQHRIDVNDLTTREAEALDLNGLARVRIALEEPVAIDDYKLSRATGSFIIVDLLHFGTVGAGMVIAPQAQAARASSDVVWQPTRVTAAIRANQKSQKPVVLWFTGLSGSGQVHDRQCARTGAGAARTPFLSAGRRQRAPRTQQRPELLRSRPQREHPPHRRGVGAVRRRGADRADGVHLADPRRAQSHPRAPRRGAIHRDLSVHFAARTARSAIPRACTSRRAPGEIREFTGIDSPYEPPLAPQVAIDTSKLDADGGAVDQILRYLENKGFLHQADPGL